MANQPLLSIALPIKNGMPHLKKTIRGLLDQTYKNFELIVQDGESTDGSLEYLKSVSDQLTIKVISEKDHSYAHAYSKSLKRCQGDIVAMAACDEYYAPDAFETAVKIFQDNPEIAAFYGSVLMTDENDQKISIYSVTDYNFWAVAACYTVPPMAASFFHREKCRGKLGCEDNPDTCPDYGIWLELGDLNILRIEKPLVHSLYSRVSWSNRTECYDDFCEHKIKILRRFAQKHPGLIPKNIMKQCHSGVFGWAAFVVLTLDGATPQFWKYFRSCMMLNPESPSIEHILKYGNEHDLFTSNHPELQQIANISSSP